MWPFSTCMLFTRRFCTLNSRIVMLHDFEQNWCSCIQTDLVQSDCDNFVRLNNALREYIQIQWRLMRKTVHF